jgi:EAL domain-containing protein (putative c-di-GMP-specific phosphodiesterase class I)/GGDEF domain-containing protein
MTLHGTDGPLGVLEVHDRKSPWHGFDHLDRYAFTAMAHQLADSLASALLGARLRYDAHYDTRTGLLNRAGFTAAAAAVTRSTPGVLIQLELDILLPGRIPLYDLTESVHLHAAARLHAHAGPAALVGSLGTGAFMILLSEPDSPSRHARVAGLRAVLAQPYNVDEIVLDVAAVVGYVPVPEATSSTSAVGDLLTHAATAAAAARHSGADMRAYVPAMSVAARRPLELSGGFREALDGGQISVQYQPKIDLAARRVIGVEALVRWTHPEYGPVSPVEFVPALETTHLTPLLTGYVLDTALAAAATWHSAMPLALAVNFSALDLDNPALPDLVAAALLRHGMPAHLLTVELTESVMMSDLERTTVVLAGLRDLGVRISIDDFGTGYSSLAYLRHLPVDELKIDREFITGLDTTTGHQLVRAIITLGHNLGLSVVAEGIEHDAARESLHAMHCDIGQGYFYAKPMPGEVLLGWLTDHPTLSGPEHPTAPRKLRVRER